MRLEEIKKVISFNASSIPVLFEMCRIAKIAETINSMVNWRKDNSNVSPGALIEILIVTILRGRQPLWSFSISTELGQGQDLFWEGDMVRRLKKIMESLAYEKKVFFRLLVLVTLPLLIMGFISFRFYVKGEERKSQMALNSYSEKITQEYENVFSPLKEYYIEVGKGADVNWLASQTHPPYSEYTNLKQAQMTLSGNYYLREYVESYEFINVKQGWVLDKYGLFTFDELRNKKETRSFLKDQILTQQSTYWIKDRESPVIPSSQPRESYVVDHTGLRLIVKDEMKKGQLSWMISVKLSSKALKMISDSYEELGYALLIFNNENVLFKMNDTFHQAYSYGKITAGEVVAGNGNKYKVVDQTGKNSNLTYVIGYDVNWIKESGSFFIMTAFGIIAGFLLILILIRLTAIAFAAPLHKLESHLNERETQIRELLMSNMMKGELSEDKIHMELDKSNINICASYRVINLICKSSKKEDKQDLYGRILRGFPKELQELVFITPLYYHEMLVFIIGEEDDCSVDNNVARFYKGIKDFIKENFQFDIACGISRHFHKLTHVYMAYNEGREALYDEMNMDQSSSSLVLFDDDFSIKKQGENVYDIIMEDELIQSIESYNEKESRRILEKILMQMHGKKGFGIERDVYLMRLLTMIMNIPISHGVPLSDIFDTDCFHLYQIWQGYDIRELTEEIIRKIVHPIIQKMEERSKNGETDITYELCKLIKESKGNITLSECAERMNYSPNYLSRTLKKEKGISFTDMAARERTAQAKYMLAGTDCSIAEIAKKLEYNNAQNFIRFFKKQVGETPAVFRKKYIGVSK